MNEMSVGNEIGKTSEDDSPALTDSQNELPIIEKTYGCHSFKRWNILIAEDNELNRTILVTLLASEGMSVTEACDGKEVVDIFKVSPKNTFDCILMDMIMPNIDGIKATSMIRDCDKADARNIPIISISANSFNDDVNQALKAGVNGYISKPINKDALLSLMHSLIK